MVSFDSDEIKTSNKKKRTMRRCPWKFFVLLFLQAFFLSMVSWKMVIINSFFGLQTKYLIGLLKTLQPIISKDARKKYKYFEKKMNSTKIVHLTFLGFPKLEIFSTVFSEIRDQLLCS